MRAKIAARRRYEFFWWANILIPLAIGAVMYCILNSDVFFSSLVRFLFANSDGRSTVAEGVFSAICLYGRDFLWAYSIVFAVALLFRGSLSGLKKAFLIVLAFEIVIEILKLVSVIPGAFDIWSVVAVIVGNVLAAGAILIHEKVLV